MQRTKKQDLLRSAVELVGIGELAPRMRSSQSQLEAWMRGDQTMPDMKLIELAGVLTELAGSG